MLDLNGFSKLGLGRGQVLWSQLRGPPGPEKQAHTRLESKPTTARSQAAARSEGAFGQAAERENMGTQWHSVAFKSERITPARQDETSTGIHFGRLRMALKISKAALWPCGCLMSSSVLNGFRPGHFSPELHKFRAAACRYLSRGILFPGTTWAEHDEDDFEHLPFKQNHNTFVCHRSHMR